MKNELIDVLSKSLEFLRPLAGRRVCVGFSGGVDSTVLLHVVSDLSKRENFEVVALHVNHGLSRHASDWARDCVRVCADLGVPLSVSEVSVALDSEKGLENEAREERYAEFRKVDADIILLAHHADDQAETVLFRLARGAGVKGIAGMPRVRSLGEKVIVRPFLDVRKSVLETFAKERRLSHVFDESNVDNAFSRNFIRNRVVPEMLSAFPHFVDNACRSAGIMSEMDMIAKDMASIDEKACSTESGLSVESLLSLPQHRRRNLLRYVMEKKGLGLVSANEIHGLDSLCIEGGRVFAGGKWFSVWKDRICAEEFSAEESDETVGVASANVEWKSGVGLPNGMEVRLSWCAPEETGIGKKDLSELMRSIGVPPWCRSRVPVLSSLGRVVWTAGKLADPSVKSEAYSLPVLRIPVLTL